VVVPISLNKRERKIALTYDLQCHLVSDVASFFQVFNVILWTPIAQLVNKLQMIKKTGKKELDIFHLDLFIWKKFGHHLIWSRQYGDS